MRKEELRSIYKAIRNELENKQAKSDKICESILSEDFHIQSKVIALYMPFNNEVDVTKLIVDAIKNNKKVCLPCCINNSEMEFKLVNKLNDLTKNKFGIFEPKLNCPTILKEDINLMIIPLLAFDEKNKRLGYGKGYYDRYLLGNSTIKKIGVAYKEQYCKNLNLFTSKFDVSLDGIITD